MAFRDRIFTVRVSLPLFIVTVVAAMAVFGLALIFYIDQVQKTSDLAKDLKTTQDRNHASRLKDQANLDRQIRQLYCTQASVVSALAPGNKDAQRYAQQIREKYKCNSLNLSRPASFGSPVGSSPSATPRPTSTTSGTPSTLITSGPGQPQAGQPPSRGQTPNQGATGTRPPASSSPSSPSSSSPLLRVNLPPVCVGQVLCLESNSVGK